MDSNAVPTLPVSAITTALAEVAAADFVEWLEKVCAQIQAGDHSQAKFLPELEQRLYSSREMHATLAAAMQAATEHGTRYHHQICTTLILIGWRLAEVKLQQDALAAMSTAT